MEKPSYERDFGHLRVTVQYNAKYQEYIAQVLCISIWQDQLCLDSSNHLRFDNALAHAIRLTKKFYTTGLKDLDIPFTEESTAVKDYQNSLKDSE